MKVFPYMTGGQSAEETDFYAFGESYGGAYVVSLAKTYMKKRKDGAEVVQQLVKYCPRLDYPLVRASKRFLSPAAP